MKQLMSGFGGVVTTGGMALVIHSSNADPKVVFAAFVFGVGAFLIGIA